MITVRMDQAVFGESRSPVRSLNNPGQHRHVQVHGSLLHVAVFRVSGVGIQGIGEMMHLPVRRLIRPDGGFDQRKSQHVFVDIVAVLAVV